MSIIQGITTILAGDYPDPPRRCCTISLLIMI
ncbi:hypothetical protein DFP97_106218 [Paenibacillus prosopidis]|uniref:Uncharacterized protein n=1 Tax=Paenibacillus prosopidis TaxID=630520 RepID=A0A368W4M8_9BACL|nr:hypothetical protein DFP97_106218 [Paenibacillus prosopidis]